MCIWYLLVNFFCKMHSMQSKSLRDFVEQLKMKDAFIDGNFFDNYLSLITLHRMFSVFVYNCEFLILIDSCHGKAANTSHLRSNFINSTFSELQSIINFKLSSYLICKINEHIFQMMELENYTITKETNDKFQYLMPSNVMKPHKVLVTIIHFCGMTKFT